MRGLSPDQLRTFIEVVELGSFTAAAKRLNLSQPAVSLQIRELEARCGVLLLDRNGRKPYPTEAGRRLIVHARRILKETDDALAAMKVVRDESGNRVRVGMTMTMLSYLFGQAVRQFKSSQTAIDLSIEMAPSFTLADDVRNGNLDFAFVTLPMDDTNLTCETVLDEEVLGIVTEGAFDRAVQRLTPALLAKTPIVVQAMGDVQTTLVLNWFRTCNLTPASFEEVRTLDACRAAVAAGLGASIIPALMSRRPVPGIVELPLDPPVTRQVGFIRHQNARLTPAAEKVRDALLLHPTVRTTGNPALVPTAPVRRRARV